MNYTTFVGYFEVTPLNNLYLPNTMSTGQDVVFMTKDEYTEMYGVASDDEVYVGG